jgi:chemotaxis receptor (MCP) glutamine deamidase CheD
VSQHRQAREVTIHIGEMAASDHPMTIRTLLGSCVAACICDRSARIGGMNHFLLPGDNGAPLQGSMNRFGVHAMELLINRIMRLGGDRRNLTAKVFGGGAVLPGMKTPTVGDLNAEFVLRFLANEKIPVLAQHLGGEDALQVIYHTFEDMVKVRSLSRIGQAHLHAVGRRERQFMEIARHKIEESPSVELFD